MLNELDLVVWTIEQTLDSIQPRIQDNRRTAIKNHILGRYNALRKAGEEKKIPPKAIEPSFGANDLKSGIEQSLRRSNQVEED